MADQTHEALVTLTADLVAAYLGNNQVAVSDLAMVIERTHGALAGLGQSPADPEPEQKPAVSIRASIKPDHLVCLEDGQKLKMLKRHLSSDHGMTPAEYRAKWGLPADYPMVAPSYAAQRRALAVKIGLGRKPGTKKPVKRR